MQYWAGLQQEGKIGRFEVIVLAPSGGEVSGFLVARGTADQMDALRRSKEYQRRAARVQLVASHLSVTDAYIDEGLAQIMGDSFTDLAPLHAITTATLERVGVEALRYRPNLVIAIPSRYPPYAENDWVGGELAVGETRLRVLKLTSRCVVPTLEHGPLARAPQALRTLIAENRVKAPGSGILPCAGIYLEVRNEGTIRTGDPVTVN